LLAKFTSDKTCSRRVRRLVGVEKMANRLAVALDNLAHEHEAPIYVLERLRFAVAEDCALGARDAKRLEALDRSGEGRAFGSGWTDFLNFARSLKSTKRAA
jgi:hypothetical protein